MSTVNHPLTWCLAKGGLGHHAVGQIGMCVDMVCVRGLQALGGPIAALAFDAMGGRLYVGDASGTVTEYAVDVTAPDMLKRLR
jgi:hypothetical protein